MNVHVRVVTEGVIHHFESLADAEAFHARRQHLRATASDNQPRDTAPAKPRAMPPRLRWALEHFASGEDVRTTALPRDPTMASASTCNSELVQRLREAGYVEHRGVVREGQARTNVHRITPAGRAVLAGTLAYAVGANTRRDCGRIRPGILRVLLASDHATAMDMAIAVDVQVQSVRNELTKMTEQGWVVRLPVQRGKESLFAIDVGGIKEAARLGIKPTDDMEQS